MTKPKLLLGAHMSIASGVEKALYAGASIGCTAIQLFTGSNRQWILKKLTPESIDLFKKAQQETGITSVIAHASYLINLGSTSPQILQKSLHALFADLVRCEQLSIPFLVLHPGAGIADAENCMLQVSQSLNQIFEEYQGPVEILLENMAGQGTSVGYTFEQLAFIRANIKHNKRIGICFDTCHAWAAGYDISTAITYQQVWEDFDTIIGLKHLKAIHLNGSKKGLGSHVDRHAHIGQGLLPIEAFKLLINDERFFDIPKIIETPKETDLLILASHHKNLLTVKSLISTKTQDKLSNF